MQASPRSRPRLGATWVNFSTSPTATGRTNAISTSLSRVQVHASRYRSRTPGTAFGSTDAAAEGGKRRSDLDDRGADPQRARQCQAPDRIAGYGPRECELGGHVRG